MTKVCQQSDSVAKTWESKFISMSLPIVRTHYQIKYISKDFPQNKSTLFLQCEILLNSKTNLFLNSNCNRKKLIKILTTFLYKINFSKLTVSYLYFIDKSSFYSFIYPNKQHSRKLLFFLVLMIFESIFTNI